MLSFLFLMWRAFELVGLKTNLDRNPWGAPSPAPSCFYDFYRHDYIFLFTDWIRFKITSHEYEDRTWRSACPNPAQCGFIRQHLLRYNSSVLCERTSPDADRWSLRTESK